ncbi:MAG: hypothetical protein ACRYGR_00945 [Janthinobacterium lividum]
MPVQNNQSYNLYAPLYRRGRPKSLNPRRVRVKHRQVSYQHSNLAILHQQNKITTDQYNAGETFLWILSETRKNLPLPKLSQVKYQEKVTGIFYNVDLKNDEYVKKIFQLWHQSIDTLKKNGPLTKDLLESFIWHDDKQVGHLSCVELQLIKRGLDTLIPIYQN